MLKISWKKMNETAFSQALVNLNNSRKVDSKTAYRVGRICQMAAKEMDKAHKMEQVIREKYIVKNDDGKEPEWKDDKAKDAFVAEFNKAMEENFVEIKVHKLDFGALNGLSGLELMAIEEIVDGLPEVA